MLDKKVGLPSIVYELVPYACLGFGIVGVMYTDHYLPKTVGVLLIVHGIVVLVKRVRWRVF